jgi:hypothetical protein
MSMNELAEFVHPSSNLKFLRLIFRKVGAVSEFLQRSASLNAISFRDFEESRHPTIARRSLSTSLHSWNDSSSFFSYHSTLLVSCSL